MQQILHWGIKMNNLEKTEKKIKFCIGNCFSRLMRDLKTRLMALKHNYSVKEENLL